MYPIVDFRELGRPTRGFLSLKRDPKEIPRQIPGTLLVFEVNGELVVLRDRKHLTGKEEFVVDAVSVHVVDMEREKPIKRKLTVPSASMEADFRIEVTFLCTVTDVESVVTNGQRDISSHLDNYLLRDRKLMTTSQSFLIDDVINARRKLNARLRAYIKIKNPSVPGVRIEFGALTIETDEGTRAQAIKVREAHQSQALATIRADFDRDQAAQIETIISRGPAAIEALAFQLKELTAEKIASGQWARQDKREERLLQLLEVVGGQGQLDMMPLDTAAIVDDLMHSLSGRPQSAVGGKGSESDFERPSLSRHDEGSKELSPEADSEIDEDDDARG